MTKVPSSARLKLATSLPVAGLKATTWAPTTPAPFFVTRPLMLPVECRNWSLP